MKDVIFKLDHGVESVATRINQCLQVIPWVKRKTAEILMASSIFGIEIWREGNFYSWFMDSFRGFFTVMVSMLIFFPLRGEKKELELDIERAKAMRPLMLILYSWIFLAVYRQLQLDLLYLYVFLKYHNDDDECFKK